MGSAQRVHHVSNQRGHVHWLQLQALPADSREGEETINHFTHFSRAVGDDLEQATFALFESAFHLFGQHLGKTVGGPYRGAKVVRDGITKGLEFLVGGRQFGGAFVHPLVEDFVEPPQLGFRLDAQRGVAEHHHRAGGLVVVIADGCGAVVDGPFASVLGQEEGIAVQI